MQTDRLVPRRWKLKHYSYLAAIFGFLVAAAQLLSSSEAQMTIENMQTTGNAIVGPNDGTIKQKNIVNKRVFIDDRDDKRIINQPTYQGNRTTGDNSPILQGTEGNAIVNYGN